MNILTNLKLILLGVCCCLITPVFATTPDGQTPAEETICDPLRANGVTKGLYGLCVAVCEAQDCDPVLNGDGTLDTSDCTPAGAKLIEKYNARRDVNNPLDLAMPCLPPPPAPCPCFNAEQAMNVGSIDERCVISGPLQGFLRGSELLPSGEEVLETLAIGSSLQCLRDTQEDEFISLVGITLEQTQACEAIMLTECANRGL